MSEDSDDTGLDRCANCGERLDANGRWYPTLARRAESGLELFAFCDAACRRLFRGDE